jgi:drug/metabolite transporter (DMT)-like permease
LADEVDLGILLCAAAIGFFSTMYLLLGRSQKRGAEPMGIKLAAFITGTEISIMVALPLSSEAFPGRLILVGSLIGVTAGLGLLGTTIAVRAGVPVSIVNGAVSLCLIIPVLLSSLLYHEMPSPRKWAGVVLAAFSIILIQKEQK